MTAMLISIPEITRQPAISFECFKLSLQCEMHCGIPRDAIPFTAQALGVGRTPLPLSRIRNFHGRNEEKRSRRAGIEQ